MIENLELLNEIIIGRVTPHIYAFSTNTIPNYLKIGDTYRPVNIRLNEWKRYFPTLKKEYSEEATINESVFFRDYSVHQYLETELGKERLLPKDISNGYYSNEFFKDTSCSDINAAIQDIKDGYEKSTGKYQYYNSKNRLPETLQYASKGFWQPRPNQKATIDNFTSAIKSGRTNLLMYAVMRFGKSFTALCCAKEMNEGKGANLVLVVSAKADVCDEWKKTVQQADNFNKEYVFLTSENLLNDSKIIKRTFESKKKAVIFLTLQDLQGEQIKEKHIELFDNTIDLLIIDETHYGARAEKYGQVLRDSKHTQDVKDKYIDEDYMEAIQADELTKELKANIKLHLSGTPYRILMGSEFEKEDIIAFYQFTDIVDEQKEWDNLYLLEDNDKDGKPVKEWDNPYYGFPEMIRFAFNPSTAAKQKLAELKNNGYTYAFSALLKPKSVKKTNDNSHKLFEHEQEVLDLFMVIDGCKEDNELLGFLDYDKIKSGKMCRHIVCVLPYCASCDALEKLLIDNRDTFKNLKDYNVINISGIDKPNEYKSVKSIKSKIESYEENGEKTITLTVNRMLTGSTVKEWDTMLFLKDTASPQEYDQAIFRLQNQYIKEFVNENGETIKFNMKPQTLLVDFDPNRIFYMQEQKSLVYNANTDEGGNQRLEQRVKKELEVSPIIAINKNRLLQVKSADILDAVSEYSKNRGVLDECQDVPVDMSLLKYSVIKSTIERQAELGSKKGLQIDGHNGEENDFDDVGDTDSNDNPNDGNNDNNEGNDTDNFDTAKKELQQLESKFRMYYSRILFYAFLSDSQLKSLDDIICSLEDYNNQRIANNLDLHKNVIRAIRENINLFILSKLDYKIQNINSLSKDTSVSPVERAVTAINKFGKLSESEIPTPLHIAKDMIELLPHSSFEKIKEKDTVVLDIASKIGEFPIAICEKAIELGITKNEIKSSVLAIPTSKIAYEFTRKVYSMLGLDINCIAREFNAYDLLEIRKIDNDGNKTKELDYDKIKNLLTQNKNLCDIRLDDKIDEGDDKVKIEAVVGNPPYNETIGNSNDDNSSLSKQLFPMFIEGSILLNTNYVSLITPSRWFTGDAQDKSFVKLREFLRKNNSISDMYYYPDAKHIFKDVQIKGGIDYFLYNKNFDGKTKFTTCIEDSKITKERNLFIDGLDVIIPNSEDCIILSKVKNNEFKPLTEITTGRNAFNIIGKPENINTVSKEEPFPNCVELRCKANKIRYINPDIVSKNRNIFEKYKIFISKSAGNPISDFKVIGLSYIGNPFTACTDSLFPIGCFDTKFEAESLQKYMSTKFLRYMVSILKSSQNVTQIVYGFVPLQDFTDKSDIDWSKSIPEIDKQLYAKYKLTDEEIAFIESKIKPME